MSNPNIKAGPGRPKGLKNKLPTNLKARMLSVWEELAKENKDLLDCARDDPPWFYVNFVKPMLPKDVLVSGDEEGGPVTIKIERVIIDNVTDQDS